MQIARTKKELILRLIVFPTYEKIMVAIPFFLSQAHYVFLFCTD